MISPRVCAPFVRCNCYIQHVLHTRSICVLHTVTSPSSHSFRWWPMRTSPIANVIASCATGLARMVVGFSCGPRFWYTHRGHNSAGSFQAQGHRCAVHHTQVLDRGTALPAQDCCLHMNASTLSTLTQLVALYMFGIHKYVLCFPQRVLPSPLYKYKGGACYKAYLFVTSMSRMWSQCAIYCNYSRGQYLVVTISLKLVLKLITYSNQAGNCSFRQ